MSTMTENIERIGNFTSSEIFKLMTNGKGRGGIGATAESYIEECNLERKLGRCISTETYTRDMAWGSFLEYRVFELVDFDYELVSSQSDIHPEFDCWAGSKDLIVPGKKIGEIKCYQPKNFAKYTDAILLKNIAVLKTDFPKEYWQLVSNAIINSVPNAEAITYMPYQSELQIIREMVDTYDQEDAWKYRFIVESEDSSLAYLPDNGYYKNLNRFEFEVPKEDIQALTDRVKFCQTLLTPLPCE